MVNLQENEDVLTLSCENKFKVFYDAMGLACFFILGLALIHPYNGLNLTDDELTAGWFTALGGIGFCILMLFTHEHTSRWIFDRKSSYFFVEYQGITGCRRFKSPLEQIRSVKVTHLNTGSTEIVLPDLELSMGKIPLETVSSYAETIKDFLNLGDLL